jgi:hypothetical protein
MALIFWKTQKRPLRPEDVDNNFEELNERLEKLEKNPPQPDQIAHIRLKGNALIFEGTKGTIYPEIPLPFIGWKIKGAWASTTEYNANDIVQQDSCLYVCKQFHISENKWNANYSAYWDLLWAPVLLSLKMAHDNPSEGDLALSFDKDQKKKIIVCYINEKWTTVITL